MLPELRKCLGRKAGLLSGGEQQMLAIGRALVTRPRLLLVDEMSLGLAPVIVERLLPILRRAADELGASVLFVEQHVALALEVSDRAYVLTHGRIVLEGPAAELRERRELLAASYLGEQPRPRQAMNEHATTTQPDRRVRRSTRRLRWRSRQRSCRDQACWQQAAARAVSGSSSRVARASRAARAAAERQQLGRSSTAAASGDVFGTPKKATGTPYVFGMINDETGAVTFPEARQGAIAAANYVNNYLGGINGHPIQIDNCIGDGTPGHRRAVRQRAGGQASRSRSSAPPTSARRPRSRSTQHANLAYLGGIPFTPVPATAPNSIQFWSVSVGDNAAASVYAGKTLGVKSVAIMYFSNPQGESLLPQITPVFKAAGVTTVKDIPLSPTSPDPSPQAALVESSGADLVYVDVPNGCGNVLKALKSVGYTRQADRHRPVQRAAGDRRRRRRSRGHVHRLAVPAPERQQPRRRSCSRRR